ncbi:hypothetical protein ACSVIJ_04950 [Pseudomonas sp. NCHU5208]|uniref:hypothetical protein n=1 Tax=unclassified Pseudomonas TaxID=196821 RepID=UPI003F9D44C8
MSADHPLLRAITMLQDYKGDLAGRDFPATGEGMHQQTINENKRASIDAAIAELHQLRTSTAGTTLAIPDECPLLITFDDTERQPLVFAGTGARSAALKAWAQISQSWNAHLFARIERNSRDDRYPSATVAIQDLAAGLEQPTNQGWVNAAEQQPLNSEPVWCFGTYDGQLAPCGFEGYFRDNRWYCLNNGDYIDGGYGDDYPAEVMLWRPLPEVSAQLLASLSASS